MPSLPAFFRRSRHSKSASQSSNASTSRTSDLTSQLPTEPPAKVLDTNQTQFNTPLVDHNPTFNGVPVDDQGPTHRRPGPPPTAQYANLRPVTSPNPHLTILFPAPDTLLSSLSDIQSPNHDASARLAWCRDVFSLRDKYLGNPIADGSDTPDGPANIEDPKLNELLEAAIPVILHLASSLKLPDLISAEALYWRGTLALSGSHPWHVPQSHRNAHQDFQDAGSRGYSPAWFGLGKTYEAFEQLDYAKECFEKGVSTGEVSCLYRMSMAHLHGLLSTPINPQEGISLLHQAAAISTSQVPQPAYTYALLLLNDYPSLQNLLPSITFDPFIPPGSSALLEAKRHLGQSAYLGYAPAQLKVAQMYEFSTPPFAYSPFMSTQYYMLASHQGLGEADMGLSKWFLCGPIHVKEGEGGFEQDEGLAYMYAEKAARKGVKEGEFAMRYFLEMGIGCRRDLVGAAHWYTLARDHGAPDAAERLEALLKVEGMVLYR